MPKATSEETLNKPRRFTAWIVSGLSAVSIAIQGMGCGTSPDPAQVGSDRSVPSAVSPQTPPVDGHDEDGGDAGPGAADRRDATTAPASPRCAPPDGFEDLQQTAVGVAFDVRYASDNNFTGAPLPGYENPWAWGIEGLGAALTNAAQDVAAHGYGLVVYDAYRPPQASTAMVSFARESGHPDWLSDGYIAAKSNHGRGTTVDLGLRLLGTGQEVDMGTPFDTFSPRSHYRGVKGQPLKRRTILRRAMTSAGFTPYDSEWWHFELKHQPRPSRRPGSYACPR